MKAQDFSDCDALLFDFGGTLDSDGEHWLDRFYALFERAGIDLPKSRIKQAFYHADAECCRDPQVAQMGLRALMKYHVGLQFAALEITDDVAEEAIVAQFCAKTEGALKRNGRLLRRLKTDYRLGVISNFYGNVAVLCREAGLADCLELILDSVEVGVSKPDLEIFRMALRQLDVVPAQAVVVGDSYERDIIPAQQLGVKTIWLKGPNPRIPDHAAPANCEISSLMELEALIR